MPEPAAVVTDTHPLLFHAAGGQRLGRKAARAFDACERQQSLIYVPAAVLWEVSLLVRVGKVSLGRPVRAFFGALFSNPAYQALDLTPEQIYEADEERPNQDPFDGLICAAARSLDLPLLTRDQEIQDWGLVDVIW